MISSSCVIEYTYVEHTGPRKFSCRSTQYITLCKTWKMVAYRLQNEAKFMQLSPHNLLKLLTLKSSESSENPRVGSSILSLGTKKKPSQPFGSEGFLLKSENVVIQSFFYDARKRTRNRYTYLNGYMIYYRHKPTRPLALHLSKAFSRI